jgi:hypothetical protein
MKKILSIFLVFTILLPQIVFAQASNPNDTYMIGQSASVADKGLIFNTGDGASNKKLLIEDTFKLKFDGNQFQIGDGALAADKSLIFNGTSGKALKYDFTNTEFNLNDDTTIAAGSKLKTNSIDAATSTVTSVEQDLRVKGKTRIGTGNNYIGITSGNIVFSNDGTLEKKLGSGSGSGSGGTPLNTNDSFEDGVSTGYATSGGTFTQLSYSGSAPDSDLKYSSFVATASGQYFETSLVTTPQNITGGCLASLDYYSTDADGTWKLQVYDSSSNLLTEQSLAAKDFKAGFAPFKCPTVGTQIKARVISTAAGTILSDHVYLGKDSRTYQVAQTTDYGGINNPEACTGSVAVGAATSFSTCAGTARGKVSLLSGGRHGVSLPVGSPAGTYKIHANYLVTDSQATGGLCYAYMFVDGVQKSQSAFGMPTNNDPTGALTLAFDYEVTASLAAAKEIELKGQRTVDATCSYTLEYFTVTYQPSASQTAIVPEAQGWFIDANIGGASPTLGTSSVSSYTEISHGSLDMVLRSGSASAKIPCSTTNAATGLTCSAGNESLGVNFIPPQAGYYEICADFSNMTNIAAAAVVHTTFEMIETPNGSQTIVQEGGSRMMNSFNATSTAIQQAYSQHNCGLFYFSSATERTVRLMYEMSASGTVNFSQITGDRSGTYGQPDIRITVRPTDSPYNRPYLSGDQVIVTGTTKAKKFAVRSTASCGSSPCATSVLGTMATASSATRSSTGTYAQGFTGCTSTPFCTGGIMPFVSNSNKCTINPTSSSNINIICTNTAGSVADDGFQFECTCE